MDFKNVLTRDDGSFVVTLKGLPYHVPDDETHKDLFEEVQAFALANPGAVKPDVPFDANRRSKENSHV